MLGLLRRFIQKKLTKSYIKSLFETDSVWLSYRKFRKDDSKIINMPNFISF